MDPWNPTIAEDADDLTGPILGEGDSVVWTYLVRNTGTAPIENVVVTDDAGTSGDAGDDFNPTFVDGDYNNNDVLDPGETWLYRSESSLAAPGPYRNVASVAGEVTGGTVTDADANHHFGEGEGGAINVEKAINAVVPLNPTAAEDADVTGPVLAEP